MKLSVYNHVTNTSQEYGFDDTDELSELCYYLNVEVPHGTLREMAERVADELSTGHLDAYVVEEDPEPVPHAIHPHDVMNIAMSYMDEPGVMERASAHDHLPTQDDDLAPIGHVTHSEVEDGSLS